MAVLVLDEQRIIRRVNQLAARWCGASPERLLGQPLTEAALPPTVNVALVQLLEPSEAETREVYLPQQEQWVALSATRQPGGWVLYGQDITPQKRREQQYQALAENTPDVLTRWGSDLRLRYANAAFADKSGTSLVELRGRTNREMGQPEDIAGPYMEALQRVFDTGRPQEHFNSFPTSHGEVHYYSRLVPELREGRIETVLGIARDITALKQNESVTQQLRDALAQRTTDHYHALFHRMDQGFSVLELQIDATGRQVVDFTYQQLNPAFFQQSGISADVLGKTSREVMPDLERFWFDTYGRVALTGESERLEHYVPQVDRWFDVYTFRVGELEARKVGVLFSDITARKRREANLTFLAEASEDLVQLTDIDETINALGEKLAAHLGLSACVFAELLEDAHVGVINHGWHRADMPSLLGTYRMRELMTAEVLQSCRAGEAVVIRDVFADPRTDGAQYAALNIGSFVSMPLVRDGAWRFLLVVYQSEPHDWRADEIDLIREITARIWTQLERARAEAALAASEAKYRVLFDSIDEGFVTVEILFDAAGQATDFRLLELNQAYERMTGMPRMVVGRRIRELVPDMEETIFQRYGELVRTGEPVRYEQHVAGPGRWFDAFSVRVGGAGSRIVATVFNDITVRKQQEQQQAFLLRFSDALRAGTSATNVADRALGMLGEQLQLDRCYIGIYHLAEDRATFPHQVGNHRIPPLPAEVRLSDFPDALRVAYDRTLRIDDLAQTEGLSGTDRQNLGALGLRALVAATLRREGAGPQWAIVALSADVRHWTPGEVALLEEATERTWAAVERARAEEALRLAEERHRGQLEQQVAERTQELQESRRLLQTVFDASPTAIVVMRLLHDAAEQAEDFKILVFNAFNQQVTGRDDIVGQRFTAMFPQTVPTGILARLLAVATTGEPADFEQWYEGEGMRHWFRHSVVWQDGLLVLTSEVITARKLLEQAQAQSLALLLQSEAVAGMGSWEYDLGTRAFIWSDGMYRLFEQRVDSTIKLQFLLDAVLDDDRPAAAQLVRTLTAEPRSFDTTLRLRIGAAVKTVRFKAVPLPDAPGPPERVLGVCLDISDVQRLEAENLALKLDRHKELLLAILQAQETERQRLGEVLHNGLGQILFAIKLRLDQLDSPALQALPAWAGLHQETARLLAEAIRQNRTLAHELVPTSLLDYGLAAAVRDVCRDLSTPQLRITCNVWGEEPEQEKTLPQSVQVVLFRLAQELALNIVRHAEATQATLELETMAGGVSLRAEDNGRGFDPRTVAEGLGLRTVRDAVALLGGTVAVDSSPEFGTHVRLYIPLPLFS